MSNLVNFQRMTEAGGFDLIGDVLIVEEIPVEEKKTKSGLIMNTGGVRRADGLDMNQPLFVRVLAVGAGFYNDENGTDVPLECQVGDIILVGRMSVNWFSTFGPLISEANKQIGVTRESEMKMRFKGQEGYDLATSALGGGTK